MRRIRAGRDRGKAFVPAGIPPVRIWLAVFTAGRNLRRITEQQLKPIGLIDDGRNFAAELRPDFHANRIVLDSNGLGHAAPSPSPGIPGEGWGEGCIYPARRCGRQREKLQFAPPMAKPRSELIDRLQYL